MGRKICSCILNTERLHTNKFYFVPSFLLLHIPSLARLLFLFISSDFSFMSTSHIILSSYSSSLLFSSFSSILCVQTGSEAHPASCTMDIEGPFAGTKAQPGRDADHSPVPPIGFSGPGAMEFRGPLLQKYLQ
jgi:hypothetical protein